MHHALVTQLACKTWRQTIGIVRPHLSKMERKIWDGVDGAKSQPLPWLQCGPIGHRARWHSWSYFHWWPRYLSKKGQVLLDVIQDYILNIEKPSFHVPHEESLVIEQDRFSKMCPLQACHMLNAKVDRSWDGEGRWGTWSSSPLLLHPPIGDSHCPTVAASAISNSFHVK